MKHLQTFFKSIFSFLLLFSLFACGGGGGDTSDGITPVTVPDLSERQLMTKYTGSIEAASLTEDELYPVLSYLFEGDVAGLTARQENTLLKMGEIKAKFQHRKKNADVTSRAKESRACLNGGELVITENLREPGLGQVSYNYNQCHQGDIIFSGSVFYDLIAWGEGEVGEFNIVYDNYTEQYFTRNDNNEISFDNYKKLTGKLAFSGGGSCQQITTSNLLLETNKLSVLEVDLKSEVFSCVDNYGETPKQNLSGKIYFSNMGYLNLKTDMPIKLNSEKQLTAGKLRLSNELSSIILETVTAKDYKGTAMTTISVNYNNDANLDREISVPSWYLMDAKYSDLADDDGDGLLNLWEIDNGLDATLSNKNIDSDKDGFLDYYEYLANTDPLDIYSYPNFSISIINSYYVNAYVNETIEIPLNLNIEISDGLISLMKNTVITMPLTPEHSWSLANNSSGCRILNSEVGGQQLLSCDEVNFSTTDYLESSPLVILQVTLNDTTAIDLQAKLETDIPYSSEYLKVNLTPNRSDLAYRVRADELGLVKDNIEESIEYTFSLQADPQGESSYSTINIYGKITNNEAGIFIKALDTSNNYGMKCTFSDVDFSCYDIPSYSTNNFTLMLTKPAAMGHVDLEFSTSTIYTSKLSQSKITTGSLSIGQNMSALKAQIDATVESEITVTPGIYIGNISLDRAVSLKGENQVEIWLTDNDGNAAFQSTEPLNLDGFDVYTNSERSFSINGGTFSHNKFKLVKQDWGFEGLVSSNDALQFVSNEVFLQKRLYGTNFLLSSAGKSIIANNLFVAPINANCTLWAGLYYPDSAEYGSINLINNTIVNFLSLVNFADETSSGSNNLIIQEYISYNNTFLNGLSLVNSILPTYLSETSGEGNVFTDDTGADSNNGYRLLTDSVAIDAGIDLSGLLSDDLDGNSRASDGVFDIGAYEFQY